MPEKPPKPPADALAEDISVDRKRDFSMIKGDLKEIVGLDSSRISLIAEFIHLNVENKDSPLDAKEVKLMRDFMRLILKNGDSDFLQTLNKIIGLVRENMAGPKIDATMGRKK